ncbi:MAG: FHA domain-containing protein, partial [Myxococcota bacterium]
YLTDTGVKACAEDVDIASLGPSRSFSSSTPSRPSPPPPTTSPSAPPSSPDRTTPPDAPRLIHVDLDGHGSVVPLKGRCTVGRTEDNDVQVDDKRASKHHAVVRFERGAYVLEDLESANGTLLNGHYCVEPTRLKNDDEIVIGRTMLVFQAPEHFPPPAEASSPAPVRRSSSRSGPRRPGSVSPELADPGIRVVRGRPEPSPEHNPRALFEGQRAPGADVFGDEESLENTAPPQDNPGSVMATETAPTTRLTSDLKDSLHDLQPTLLPQESMLPAVDPEPPQEILELSEVVETPTPTLDPPTQEFEKEDPEPTLIGEMKPDGSLGEKLPDASSSLADVPLPSEVRARIRADGTEGLYGELLALRAHVSELGGKNHPLLEVIDTLLKDPIVRAFVEHARQR